LLKTAPVYRDKIKKEYSNVLNRFAKEEAKRQKGGFKDDH
jgi:hypothetical protein